MKKILCAAMVWLFQFLVFFMWFAVPLTLLFPYSNQNSLVVSSIFLAAVCVAANYKSIIKECQGTGDAHA